MRALSWVGATVACAVVLAAAGLAVVGWVFSTEILVPQPYGLQPEFELVTAGDTTVTMPAPPPDPPQFARTDVEGIYGLRYRGGAARLGPVLSRSEERVTRTFHREEGRPPRAGDPARLDITVFRRDPGTDHGLSFQNVRIDAPVGPVPAWWLDAGAETAVLMLHGRRRADRTEALRSLPLYRRAGASVLVASYRNHDDAPPSADGFYHYGHQEAGDARAAARFLAEHGARRVVLVGFSMGAAVALEALEAWPNDAPDPAGLVLEAPMVDPRPVFRAAAARRGVPVPGLVTDVAMRVARWRAGVPWPELDQRRLAPRLELPALVIAGTRDGTVPVASVDAFVARLPGEPRYLRLDGVEHMEAWNAAPARYRQAVNRFLSDLRIEEPPFRGRHGGLAGARP